jgi:hypothetical protein
MSTTPATIYLKYRSSLPVGPVFLNTRFSVLANVLDASDAINKDYVNREPYITHVKCNVLWGIIREEHPMIGGHAAVLLETDNLGILIHRKLASNDSNRLSLPVPIDCSHGIRS